MSLRSPRPFERTSTAGSETSRSTGLTSFLAKVVGETAKVDGSSNGAKLCDAVLPRERGPQRHELSYRT